MNVKDLIKAAKIEIEEAGIRRPYYRVYKRELPQCGARTRAGHPCRAKAAWDEDRVVPQNGRCRLHGGWSTGPRTEEGLARVAEAAREAQLRRWEKYRQEKAASSLSGQLATEQTQNDTHPKTDL